MTKDQLVDEVLSRTLFEADFSRQPGPSIFKTTYDDLYALKKAYEAGVQLPIKVYHRSCGAQVNISLMSTAGGGSIVPDENVVCTGWTGEWNICDFKLSFAQAKDSILTGLELYTELEEDAEELNSWPHKLTELMSPGRRGTLYTTVQPLDQRTIIERRVERLLKIRGGK